MIIIKLLKKKTIFSVYLIFFAEDRHRELDDILSDMLLTVQDIPDIGKGSTLTKKPHNHHMNLATNQNQHQPQYQYNTDTVKRSQTSSTISVQDDRRSTTPINATTNTAKPSSSTNHTLAKELDYYETSSTTTTITPPPSESGRETPLINVNNNPTHQTAREKREITSTSNTSTLQRGGSGSTNREHQHQQQHKRDIVMDLQNNHHQSFVYPQQSRTDFVYATSEDEENIPYHAREDSRPFTYGNPTGVQLSPNGSNSGSGGGGGTGMLKMQSGLSSPSLVRKTLVRGASPASTSSVSGRKANVRNDFEEMLMQRREKILNEKYSIGDKTPNGSAQYASSDAKWNSVISSSNGYHHHEPLKRSNTMDGGFGRSISSDG